MATIRIDNEFRIKSDPYQWILQKSRYPETGKHKGELVWDSLTFHASIKQACDAYLERSLRHSDATSFNELRGIADDCQSAIESMVTL